MTGGQTFRASAGAVVIDRDGRVLAFERADAPGAWQLPQGGLDEGEEPEAAARRELFEETGIAAEAVELLGVHPRWLAYELPPERRTTRKGRGQVQRWFLFRLEGGEAAIDLKGATSAEFTAWRWTTLRELAAETVSFRQPVYRELAAHFAVHLAP